MTRFCSIFNQLLQLFPRAEFQAAVAHTDAERHHRGFESWTQFVAMLFCHLGQAQSLREICGGLASCEGKLQQLGVAQAPKRSTRAYANAHRPWQLFEGVFHQLLARCRAVAGPRRFRFKNKLLSLDATVIDLCATAFPWATIRRTKGAEKLHFTLDHDGYLPTYLVITDGRVNETRVARAQTFTPGTILVFDRGYTDFAWFATLTAADVFFVTRLKSHAAYEVRDTRPVPAGATDIVTDDEIAMTVRRTQAHYPGRLRRVVLRTADGETLEFLTNQFTLAATTIAAIYKDRWQIELFFKALKQHLRVKTFVGTSANALHTQVWTALIALLLLKFLQLKARFGWSLSNLVALLRLNLFVYRPLGEWLDAPFASPPIPAGPVQARLPLA
jgi:IS4 transposase